MPPLPSSTRPLDGISRVAAIFGGVLLLVLTLPSLSATRIFTWPWALGPAALWALPVGLTLIRLAKGIAWLRPSALLVSGLLSLVACSLLSAALSPFSAASCTLLAPTLGGVALFFLLFDFLANNSSSERPRGDELARWLALGGAMIVTVSLIGWLVKSGGDLAIRNDVPFGHSNYTAGCMVLVLPWFFLRTWLTKGIYRAGWLVLCAAALLVLASTNSRGGLLAGGIVAVLALIVVLVRIRRSLRWKLSLLIGASLVAALVVASNSRLRELATGHGWNDAARESNRQRFAMLDAGWHLGLERPILGWGPGTVPLAFPRVRQEISSGVENVLQLHNTLAQIWACLGTVGIIVSSLIALSAVMAFSRSAMRPSVLAAAASLLGYGAMSFTDHQLDVPVITVLCVTALALLVGTERAATWQPRRSVSVLLLIAVFAALIWPAILLGRDLVARSAYNNALTALEQRDADIFLKQLDRAARFAPWDPYFLHRKADFFIVGRQYAEDKKKEGALVGLAIANLEASLATGAHLEFAHFNLGWLNLDLGRPAQAARHFLAAARLVPDKGGVYLGLGLALQTQSKTTAAIRAYALAWINDPLSATDPMWEQPDFVSLCPSIHTEVQRIYAGLRETLPAAVQAEAWAQWWQGQSVVLSHSGRGFNDQAEQFIALQPRVKARQPIEGSLAWMDLYRAWASPNPETAFQRYDPPLSRDLASLARAHPDSFQSFLTGPIHEYRSLVKTLHFERSGYGVLARHPDGPPLVDAYVAQHNVMATDFAPAFFPPKGWLPGRLLLALLPPDAG